MTVTTSANTPVGSSTLTITGTSGALVHTATVTLNVTTGGTTGSLAGSLATPSGTQNLTALGTLDWAHWGLTSASSFNHKAGVTSQISNFTVVGTGAANRYADNAFGFSWTGGTPTASATNSTTGVYISGVGNGFQITAPADTTQRTLTVFVDSYHAQGKMVAHLSDASSPDYVNTTINSIGLTVQGAFTFVYKAASSGQTLSVTFTNIANNSSNAQHRAGGGGAGGNGGEPGLLAGSGSGIAIGGGGRKHCLHSDGDGAERVHGEHGVQCKWAADRRDGELQSDDGDGDGIVHHDGDDEREYAGGKFHSDHNRDKRSAGPYDDGDAGSYGSGRFLAGGGAGIAIGGGGRKHGLHGDGDGAERVHGEHGLRGKRVADGSDSEFQSDDGDGDGIVHHDGDDEREYAGGKFHADHNRDERSAGP